MTITSKSKSGLLNLSPEKLELLAQVLKKEGLESPQSQAIPKRASDAELPLSFTEQRLWILWQLNPQSPFDNNAAAFYLEGQLDVQALQRSLREIVRRHEIWRTSFVMVDGQLVRRISETMSIPLPIIDLQALPESEQKIKARRIAGQQVRTPFDLSADRLARTTLIRFNEQLHALLLVVHHIITDGWSTGLFIQEFASLYAAYASGKPSPLPELPIQYADFALWQRQRFQDEMLTKEIAYWKKRLGGELPVMELPTDRLRPPVQNYEGTGLRLAYSEQLAAALRQVSRKEGVSLFMLLLAAFVTLLFRYSRQEDLVIGSPIANRSRVEIEKLLGNFVNNLVLRINMSGNPRFRDLLGRVREICLEAYSHQDLPFEKLVEVLRPRRDPSHHPLFQVAFEFINDRTINKLELPGLTIRDMDIDYGTVRFDLHLVIQESERELTGWLMFKTGLFDVTTVKRIAGHFQTLLEEIVKHPEMRISELPILTPPEREQLLYVFNSPLSESAPGLCVHQLFDDQAKLTPDSIALIDGDEQLTYRELNRRANALACHLQSLGVGPEVPVGICLDHPVETIVGLFGILKAGGAYVPLEPDYPAQRLSFMMKDAKVKVVLTEERFRARLLGDSVSIVCMGGDEMEAIEREHGDESPASRAADFNLAYVLYTSGSTGQPKAVEISHRSLINVLYSMHDQLGVGDRDTFLSVTRLSFDIAGVELFLPLIIGARLVRASRQMAFDGVKLLQTIKDSKATVLQATPATWRLLLQSGWEGKTPVMALSAGEPLSRELADQILERCPSLWNLYGPTETTIYSTYSAIKRGGGPVLIGRPVANTEIYILDDELQMVPIGVTGELYIGGEGVARGYRDRPDLTAERFVPHPFCRRPGARLYRTGDMARYLADGNIELFGRRDYQVKVRGYRIELGEIEAVVERHPAVRGVVVVARSDGAGSHQLGAYVTTYPGEPLTVSHLREFVQEYLPGYMVPSTFVFLESFPLTANGKVDRKALPVPEGVRPELREKYLPPRTELEQTIAAMWQEALQVADVGVHDNFFELGGHSLLAVQFVTEMRNVLQVDIPMQDVFENPTVAGLAAVVEKIQKGLSSNHAEDDGGIDLPSKVTLDSDICLNGLALEHTTHTENVFLTGATGFLGAFLLDELLRQTRGIIYCLVRSSDSQDGMKRLKSNMESYGLWASSMAGRVRPVPGDLSLPLLGMQPEQFKMLAEEIDLIYHNGSQVNFVQPYHSLEAANVQGTQEVLRLAVLRKVKPVHYVSTIATLDLAPRPGLAVGFEEDKLESYENLHSGYRQSKWVAEKIIQLAQSRGIPVSVYRPGYIVGHSATGVCNTNDFVFRMLKGWIQLGIAPDVDESVYLTPVDYISRAVVTISRDRESTGKAFHVINPVATEVRALIDWTRSYGYSIQTTTPEQWRRVLSDVIAHSEENALYPLLPTLLREDTPSLQPQGASPQEIVIDCRNTTAALAQSSVTCPPISQELLETYFSYLTRSGFLPLPGSDSVRVVTTRSRPVF